MSEDMSLFLPRDLHPGFALLGKKNWVKFFVDNRPGEDQARSSLKINNGYLNEMMEKYTNEPGVRVGIKLAKQSAETGQFLNICFTESLANCLANGPKIFYPTIEQFDSMVNVDMHMPVRDFRSPYPSIVIRVPNECRKFLSELYGLDVQRMPLHVLVRTRYKEGDEGDVVIFIIMKFPEYETCYLIQENPNHKDIEAAICKWIPCELDKLFDSRESEFKYTRDIARASLNLCLMMAHFGCKLGGPLNKRQYDLNKKPGREKYKHSDFLAVNMTQNVVIRQQTPKQPGEVLEGHSGYEVKPHWRRGHWRRKPGWEAFVERNEQPPLSFVRPCLVRADRIVGDVKDSQATYRSKA